MFYPKFGADALLLSFPAGIVATAVMGAGLYLYGAWRKGKVLPPKETAQQCEEYRAQGSCSSSCSDILPTTLWKRSEERDTVARARS